LEERKIKGRRMVEDTERGLLRQKGVHVGPRRRDWKEGLVLQVGLWGPEGLYGGGGVSVASWFMGI